MLLLISRLIQKYGMHRSTLVVMQDRLVYIMRRHGPRHMTKHMKDQLHLILTSLKFGLDHIQLSMLEQLIIQKRILQLIEDRSTLVVILELLQKFGLETIKKFIKHYRILSKDMKRHMLVQCSMEALLTEVKQQLIQKLIIKNTKAPLTIPKIGKVASQKYIRTLNCILRTG